MKHTCKAVFSVIDSANDWVGKVSSFLILVIVLAMVYETVMRYFFGAPTKWSADSSVLIEGVFLLLGGGYVLRHKGHINMDVVYNRFSIRGRAILDLFTSALFFMFCYVLLRYGGPYAWKSLIAHELTQPPGSLPLYFTKMALPVGAFLLGIQGLVKFMRDLIIAITGRQYEY